MFVLGSPEDSTIQDLKTENDRFGDLLILDITESYETLTEKAVGWMKWVEYNCQKFELILKIDDDTMINIPKFLNFLPNCSELSSASPMCTHISCNIWKGVRPIRKGKNNLTLDQYPLHMFPLMCQGVAYLMPISVVSKLLKASLQVPYLYLEDVYVTGLLCHYVQQPLYPLNQLYSSGSIEEIIQSKKLIGHMKSNEDYRKVWFKIIHSN